MNSQGNGMSRVQKTNYSQREGTNWLLIGVGALLSTISIRLGFKWKQSLNSKRVENAPKYQKGHANSFNPRNSADCCCQCSGYILKQDSHGCFSCISEMQDQLAELQNSLDAQQQLSSHLQSKLDAVNSELFNSDREIQRLRKVIADHCVGHIYLNGNGNTKEHSNGESPEKVRDIDDEGRIDYYAIGSDGSYCDGS
ncbi:hypothetical protein K1719_008828 [Acacia pycnantha]|nr:hypothetical protein K1719_008828 [Acacia pycnantha]